MKRILLLAGSTLVLVPLSTWGAEGYRRVLGQLVCQGFTLAGASVTLYGVSVGLTHDGLTFLDQRWAYPIAFYGPLDLALYASLCLASLNASRRARGRALLGGLPILIAGQWLAISLCLALLMRSGAAMASGAGQAREFPMVRLVMSSLSWVGPLATWVALLARSELAPPGRAGTHGRSAGRSTPRPGAER